MIEFMLLIFFLCFGLPAILATAIGSIMIVAYISIAVLTIMIRFWYVVLIAMLIMITPILYLDGWLFPILGGFVAFCALCVVVSNYYDENGNRIQRDNTNLPTAQ